METTVETPPAEALDEAAVEAANEETPVAVKAEAEESPEQLFRWSQWVHVGPGADECDKRFSGACSEEEHFHAWCRLPNPFQIRDITEKAQAAKARRLRMLRDTDSDAYAILESDLEQFTDADKDILADEIVDKDFPDDYQAAIREADGAVDDEADVPEGEDAPRLYANIDQDREEYQRQRVLPEEERDEGFAELETHIANYSRAVEDAMEKRQAPKKARLIERELPELVEIIRRDRMEQQAMEHYLHTYSTWMWFVCTFKPCETRRPHERVWRDISEMKHLAPSEVIEALRATFEGLEGRMARSRLGKGS